MAVKPCVEPFCGRLVTSGNRCRRHGRIENLRHHKPGKLYAKKRWKILRARKLALNPLCEFPGCNDIATDVDHVAAIEGGGNPWALDNLMSLCKPHHSSKTNGEVRSREW